MTLVQFRRLHSAILTLNERTITPKERMMFYLAIRDTMCTECGKLKVENCECTKLLK